MRKLMFGENDAVKDAKTVLILSWPILILFILTGHAFSQQITKGPYLTDVHRQSVTIRWELDRKIDHQFQYGTAAGKLANISAGLRGERNGNFLYEARLENLSPASTYRYRLRFGKVNGKFYQFKSPPAQTEAITFAAIGDSRSNPPVFAGIRDQLLKTKPDLIISMGDLVANGGNFEEWDRFYFGVAGEMISQIPLMSCLGDHEGDDDDGELFRYFFMPDIPVDQLWFSYDYGPAHFVVLDYRYPDTSRMLDWFHEDMKKSDAKWKFVYMHRPCYNLGGHRSHWGSPHWPKLFAQYEIDVVFAGHSHQYERFYPIADVSSINPWPVTYITTGGAGAGLYEVMDSEFIAAAAQKHHFTTVQISGDTLRFQASLADGTRFDQFLLVKQGNQYHEAYLELVKPQPELDVINMFAGALSQTVRQIPLLEKPARLNLSFHNYFLPEPLSFQVQLDPQSMQFYRMNSFQDTLQYQQIKNSPAEIFSKGNVCLNGWGDLDPPLRLQISFPVRDKEYQIQGGKVDYWPDDDY